MASSERPSLPYPSRTYFIGQPCDLDDNPSPSPGILPSSEGSTVAFKPRHQAPLVRRLNPDFPQPALRQGDGVVMEAAGRTGRAFGTTLSSKGDGRLETLGRTHPASEGMLPLSASRPARPWRGHKFPLHRHRVCKAPRPPGAPKGKAQSPASAQMQEKLWLCSTLGNLQKPLLSERDKPPTYEASSARLRRNAPSPALG